MSPIESQLFFARAVLVLALYGFVAAVGALAWRELRTAQRAGAGRAVEPPGARLIVLSAGASERPPGTALPLGTIACIGRDLDNEVVVQDPTVSGRHAVFSFRDGAWWVEDLGSTNGTAVNGQPVAGRAQSLLRSGDVIQVGSVSLRLVAPSLP